MFNVIVALIFRESKTRFGAHRLGYIWAFIEPSVFVLIFTLGHALISESLPFGESILLFILPALLFVRIFLGVTGRMKDALRANMSLLAYPPVRTIDVIIARFILEILTMYVIFASFIILLHAFSEVTVVADFYVLFFSILGLSFLCFSVGAFNAIVSVLWPTWGQIWSWTSLPVMFLSGLFYVPAQLPDSYQNFLYWNPVLHTIEWLRTATYLSYEPLLDVNYLFSFSACALALALLLERTYRHKILVA